MPKWKLHLEPIGEDVLKRLAYIFGECSAAAKALRDASERRARGEDVEFYQAKQGRSSAILVRGISCSAASNTTSR